MSIMCNSKAKRGVHCCCEAAAGALDLELQLRLDQHKLFDSSAKQSKEDILFVYKEVTDWWTCKSL